LANIHFIDPRDPIHTVMDEIQGSGLLLSEAMHGAIVADALRTPWVALKPTDRAHHMKWDDWATSLGIVLRFRSLPFSTFQEARLRWSGVDRAAPKAGLKGAAASVVDEAGLRLAARALRTAAAGPPQLSDESMLEQRTSALLDVVQRIRTDYR
jgi:succinoglycan biosynthesis protein ExoV